LFSFIDNNSFIPESGCGGMVTSGLLFPGLMTLLRRPWSYPTVMPGSQFTSLPLYHVLYISLCNSLQMSYNDNLKMT